MSKQRSNAIKLMTTSKQSHYINNQLCLQEMETCFVTFIMQMLKCLIDLCIRCTDNKTKLSVAKLGNKETPWNLQQPPSIFNSKSTMYLMVNISLTAESECENAKEEHLDFTEKKDSCGKGISMKSTKAVLCSCWWRSAALLSACVCVSVWVCAYNADGYWIEWLEDGDLHKRSYPNRPLKQRRQTGERRHWKSWNRKKKGKKKNRSTALLK